MDKGPHHFSFWLTLIKYACKIKKLTQQLKPTRQSICLGAWNTARRLQSEASYREGWPCGVIKFLWCFSYCRSTHHLLLMKCSEECVWKVHIDCITNAVNICLQIKLIEVQCFSLSWKFVLKIPLIAVLSEFNWDLNA